MNKVLLILLASYSIAAASTANTAPTDHEDRPVNHACPVTPDETVDMDVFVEHKGERVYFCCNRCRKKFLENPSQYLATSTQSVAPAESEDPPAHANQSKTSHAHVVDKAIQETGHDHSAGHESENSKRALTFLGKFHPLVVHFPIALLLVAFLAEGLSLAGADRSFREVAHFSVTLGASGAVAAALLGWLAANGASYPDDLVKTLLYHRWLGVGVAVASVGTAALSRLLKSHSKLLVAYRGCLLLSAMLVGITGHLGATLIYGADYFTW